MGHQVLSVLGLLSTQLFTFLSEEGKLLGGLRKEVQLITDEFGHMKAFLQVVDSDKEDDPQLTEWTRQVREAAYDTEDALDEFLLLFAGQGPLGFFGSVRSNFNSLTSLPARHRLATKLQDIKARVKNISEARQRYELQYSKSPAQGSGLLPANSDWRYSKDDEALYAKEDQLVGIDKPKQRLLSQILDGDSEFKVIAVLGMGGIGKTTLVKRVLSDSAVENHFRIRAWVTVSQTYDLKELFKVLIRRLHAGFDESAPSNVDLMDIDDLKAHIRHFLPRGRYVVVFDDVWRRDFWDAFRFLLPENSYGGNRVILTTRIADVASSCIGLSGYVFRKEFLTLEQSTTLFCRKTFKDNCCPAHLEDVVKGIVEKCEGLPLAIVAIGGILATKDLNKTDQWERIRSRLGYESEGTGKLDTAKKILHMSYKDLSPTLKTCLLYTCIFPEDHEIPFRPLILRWVAERFIAREAGQHVKEVGWHYIKELANRSLIQLGEIDYDGLPEKFQIHDLLREVIVSESKKINLTTVIGNTPHTTISWPPEEKVVRRLVFHGNDSLYNFVIPQSLQYFNRLRSLITFDCTEPPSKALLCELLSSKFLKIVNFVGMQLEEIPREIFNLFHLTHLDLTGSKVKIVPKTIKRLKNLEYLNLYQNPVRELPVEILKLQKLRYLQLFQGVDSSDWDLGSYGFKAPRSMGSLLALETLVCIDAAESDKARIITEIGKLTQLRRLHITNLRREDGEEFCYTLEKLVNLQELVISCSVEKDEEVNVLDLNHHISNSSVIQSICLLDLRGRLENMPPWIPDLQNLGVITLIGSSLKDDPLESLQHLTNLIEVHLNQAYEGESLCFKSGGFQKIRKLTLRKMKGLRTMRVEEGAMPHIKELILDELPLVEDIPSGVEHLRELQKLSLWDMSCEFTNKLGEGSENYNNKRIGHILKVYIDGRNTSRLALMVSPLLVSPHVMGSRLERKKNLLPFMDKVVCTFNFLPASLRLYTQFPFTLPG